MIKPNYKKIILISLISLYLLACNPSKKEGASHFIKTIKSREYKPIEPIPQFKAIDKFVYPEKNDQKNPFRMIENKGIINSANFKDNQKKSKRISLNFKNIKIRTVLQLLAKFTGIDMIISGTVAGNTTLNLHDVPWDQALEVILTTHALAKRKVGEVMFIAPIGEMIEREKKEIKAREEVTDLAPLHSGLLSINNAKAADIGALLRDKNAGFLSTRGSLGVDTRTNVIWIQDSDTQIAKIRKLVKQLDAPMEQVLIEARLVNVTRDFAQELGVRFGVSRSSQLNDIANQMAPNASVANDAPLAERLNVDLMAVPITAATASAGIALATLGKGILLDLELSALESEGRGEIISSPRLITTNQKEAVIESGEEIPYQESTSSGATSVAFKKAVLCLKVTPQITADSRILMDLQINQDTLSPKVFNGVPSVLTKEIQTRVLVNNGQTIVLGGIYKQDKNKRFNRVPFLSELPVVGALFKNQSLAIRNEELLIFITPRIITNNLPITTIMKTELSKFSD